jgi:cytidylate kinase
VTSDFVVTIDGPAGSGKSTVARLLAKKLGAAFLDTGAMYRAVTLAVMQNGIELTDPKQLAGVLDETKFDFIIDDNQMKVMIGGVDVTEQIRAPLVTANSRYIADAPEIRSRLVEMQRGFAGEHRRVVTEGRDQGTVAFPDAKVKFYLTADVKTRAQRRMKELDGKDDVSLDGLIRSIQKRDEKDSQRSVGPLKPADDAVHVDTTDLNIEQVVDVLLSKVRKVCS